MTRKKCLTEEERKEARRKSSRKWKQNNKEKRIEYRKKYYQEHKEKELERAKQYYQDHKEELIGYQKERGKNNSDYYHNRYIAKKEVILEQQKQYYQEHKDEILEYQRQYRQEHKEEMVENKKQYRKTPIGRACYLIPRYKRSDKEHNRGECTLTTQWMIDNIFSGQRCFYCKESDWRELGCDRIDNSKPHTPDNVVTCCTRCNKKRNNKPFEEFCKEMGLI